MNFTTSTLWSFLILLVIIEGLVAGTTCPSTPYHPVPGPPGRDGRDGKDGSPGVFSYEDYIKLKEIVINDVISEKLVQIIKQEVVSVVDRLKTEMQCCRNETNNATNMTERTTPPPVPVFRDCRDALNNNYTQSGVYTIQPDSLPPFDVYCDMDTDGGGWTVFQRRQDGSVNFYRNWVNYTNGFGNLSKEFWLGLEFIHRLTNGTDSELRIDLEDWSGNNRYAQYSSFKVRGASASYRLELSGYSGNAGNSLAHHNSRPFSTYDRDNDAHFINCAMSFNGAWWYGSCHDSNLNGQYFRGRYSSSANGVVWETFKGDNYSLKFTEMKVRTTG